MAKLSVVIITLNEESGILRTLQSVKSFADEILVVDSMSTDRTPDICKEFGCRVIQRKFEGYASQKQFAADQASNDWIFLIDADEVVSEALQAEIKSLFGTSNGSDGHPPAHAGYLVPRSLFFMGKILRFGGVGKEYIIRLFDRKQGEFTKVAVHEGIRVKGSCGKLHGKLIHHSFRDISQQIEKTNIYSSLAAAENVRKGRSYFKGWVALKFPVTFISAYILKGGFLDGYPGLLWSFLAAVYSSLKIAKTIEKQRQP